MPEQNKNPSKMTTIALSRKMIATLESLKTHPRETYEDVIKRLINEYRVKS